MLIQTCLDIYLAEGIEFVYGPVANKLSDGLTNVIIISNAAAAQSSLL